MSDRIWMIRAGEGGYLAEDFSNGYVAIGWSDLGDLSKTKSRDDIRKLYLKAYPHTKPGKVDNAVAMIHKFCSLIQKGDTVVTYNPGTRQYLVGSVKSDYYFDPSIIPDSPHLRDVKWNHHVLRDDLESQTRNSLGSTLTLFSVNPEAWSDLQESITGKKAAKPTEETESDFKELKDNKIQEAHEAIKDKLIQLDEWEMQELV